MEVGLRYFGPSENLVFHAILIGEFLDKHVNQERTKFTFEDAVLERMINDVCWSQRREVLEEPLSWLKGEQRTKIESITSDLSIRRIGDVESFPG